MNGIYALLPVTSSYRRIEAGKAFLALVGEVWVRSRPGARRIEFRQLAGRQRPADGAEILAELRLVSRADAAADLAGEPAPAEWAPDDRAAALVEPDSTISYGRLGRPPRLV
jgi:hypothetical protein